MPTKVEGYLTSTGKFFEDEADARYSEALQEMQIIAEQVGSLDNTKAILQFVKNYGELLTTLYQCYKDVHEKQNKEKAELDQVVEFTSRRNKDGDQEQNAIKEENEEPFDNEIA